MNNKFKKYVLLFLLSILLSCGLVFSLNIAIDPLWYVGGNKLFNFNYSFNERFAKVNEYLKNADQYDCILLGSSRVTLLDANSISTHECFNFSFSDGNPSEFVAYAKYIRKFGQQPKLTIIGVDVRFYSRNKNNKIVPSFVDALEYPPSIVSSYLSAKALRFSLLTLLGQSPQHRYYNENLRGQFLPGTKAYKVPPCFTLEGFGIPYTDANFHYTDTLKAVLQSDTMVAYVTPISAWDMMPLLEDGQLASYLTTVYALSKKFDRFYDFSIPSELTTRSDNNYDGHHYTPRSNSVIAKALIGGQVRYGIDVSSLSFNEYRTIFVSAMKAFSATLENRRPSSWNCPHRSAIR